VVDTGYEERKFDGMLESLKKYKRNHSDYTFRDKSLLTQEERLL